ncbi:unnamed protein product [Larinioides sclopetarius]|uniref:Single domain-containing protein n=1 Tax=Larinioides sclopetarius TaxID=280406 RepID=A0AAV2BAD1_9ARAC
MKTSGLFAITISLLYLTLRTKAYEARGYTDTSDGYCQGDYGEIPLGGTGFNDERCERILCGDGMYTIQGCGVVSIADMPPDCTLVGKPGHYPDCCKTIVKCDSDSVENSNGEGTSEKNYKDSSNENDNDSNDKDDKDSNNDEMNQEDLGKCGC